jgi:hypothetical protein
MRAALHEDLHVFVSSQVIGGEGGSPVREIAE